jgi:hypothetical protein
MTTIMQSKSWNGTKWVPALNIDAPTEAAVTKALAEPGKTIFFTDALGNPGTTKAVNDTTPGVCDRAPYEPHERNINGACINWRPVGAVTNDRPAEDDIEQARR